MKPVTPRSVHFIIPSFKGAKSIESCLSSIANQSYPSSLYKISVVANGPIDNTFNHVSKFANCSYYYNHVTGRSEARNLLLNETDTEFIAYVDVDVVLNERWLEECLDKMTSFYCAAVTGPVYKVGDRWLDHFRRKVSEFSTDGQCNILENPSGLGGLNTAAVLFRTSALKKINGFDTSFKRSEDYELSHRLLRSGYILATTATATATVYWDRSILEYFVIRYFQMGFYAPKAQLMHEVPILPFWKSTPLKGFKKLFRPKNTLVLLGLLATNVFFMIGQRFGMGKFRHTKPWLPSVLAKRVIISQNSKSTIYDINPEWEIVIVRDHLRLYRRKHSHFYLLPDQFQKSFMTMLNSSLYEIKNTSDVHFLSSMLRDKVLIKVREID